MSLSIFSFSGRRSRLSYFLASLMLFTVLVLMVGVFAALFASDSNGDFESAFMPAAVLSWLLITWPSLAITAQRFHDFNLSGWWQLLNGIPYIGIIIWCALLIYPGSPGDNRFGPPQGSKADSSAAASGPNGGKNPATTTMSAKGRIARYVEKA